MRISFVLPPLNLGGGIKVVAIYAKALADQGHRITVVSPPPRRIPLRRQLKRLLQGHGWARREALQPSYFDALGLDVRRLERYRPARDDDLPDADVVVATWWETAEWVHALSPAKGAKAYFIQGHEVFPHLPVERVQATYRLPLHKIVIARWLQSVMAERYGDGEVDLVPNAVDHRKFFAQPRGRQAVPTVGFLYHDAHLKGVDLTLAAIARLRRRFPDLRILAFGNDLPGRSFAGLEGIEFRHSPPPDEIREIYAGCDAWITSSRSEGFNLPAVEAMACRTPVVATRTGWPAEAIESSRNGILVDIDDLDGLVRGAEWILGLPDPGWRRLSQAAFDTVADCSWQRSAGLFEAALRHACRRAERGEIAGRPGPAD